MRYINSVGECPQCGSTLEMYKTKKGSRLIQCENDECARKDETGNSVGRSRKKIFYWLPRKGHVESTNCYCPKDKYPIMVVEKANNSRFKISSYFFANGPCFSCLKRDHCTPVNELVVEYREFGEFGFKPEIKT